MPGKILFGRVRTNFYKPRRQSRNPGGWAHPLHPQAVGVSTICRGNFRFTTNGPKTKRFHLRQKERNGLVSFSQMSVWGDAQTFPLLLFFVFSFVCFLCCFMCFWCSFLCVFLCVLFVFCAFEFFFFCGDYFKLFWLWYNCKQSLDFKPDFPLWPRSLAFFFSFFETLAKCVHLRNRHGQFSAQVCSLPARQQGGDKHSQTSTRKPKEKQKNVPLS